MQNSNLYGVCIVDGFDYIGLSLWILLAQAGKRVVLKFYLESKFPRLQEKQYAFFYSHSSP